MELHSPEKISTDIRIKLEPIMDENCHLKAVENENVSDLPSQDADKVQESKTSQIMKIEGNGPFTCEQCGRTFTTKLRFKNHKRSHDLRFKFACHVCNRFFSSQKNLDIHLSSKVHSPVKRYHCGHCQKRFTLKLYLHRHKLRHLMTGCVVKCEHCWRRFSRVHDLLLHQKTHRKKYPCTKCPRTFYSPKFLERHNCGGLFVCECNKVYRSRRYLDLHKRSHTGERPFHCEVCQRRFKYERYLRQHMNLHFPTSDAYVCDICFKSFTKKSHLTSHKKTHSDVFDCNICGEKFYQKIELVMHGKVHKKTFPCGDCGRSFQRLSCLKRHKAIHLKEKEICEHCGDCFRTRNLLDKHKSTVHVDVPSFKCPDCSKLFVDRQGLVLHSKIHQIIHQIPDDSPGLLGYLNIVY